MLTMLHFLYSKPSNSSKRYCASILVTLKARMKKLLSCNMLQKHLGLQVRHPLSAGASLHAMDATTTTWKKPVRDASVKVRQRLQLPVEVCYASILATSTRHSY